MLDFATLTGACVSTRSPNAIQRRVHEPRRCARMLQSVAGQSGERVWCFPMDEDFDRTSRATSQTSCNARSRARAITFSRRVSCALRARGHPVGARGPRLRQHKGGLAHVTTEFTGFGVRFALELLGDMLADSVRGSRVTSTDRA